jgi:hypothetical protein
VIRPKTGGDDQHGDELTQFQQSTSLSELATPDQPRLPKSGPVFTVPRLPCFGRFVKLAG